MFKLFVFAMLVCVASAGLIGHGIAVAPVGVAVAHGASSYQNNNQISLHPTAVVATHAVAPVAIAHSPVAVGVVGHGYGLGGISHGYGLGGIGLGHGLVH